MKIFKKKKYIYIYIFFSSVEREEKTFFEKRRRNTLHTFGRERKTVARFLNHLESSNQIIVFVGCVQKRETKDDDDDDDDDSSDDDDDDRIVEAAEFFPWE